MAKKKYIFHACILFFLISGSLLILSHSLQKAPKPQKNISVKNISVVKNNSNKVLSLSTKNTISDTSSL